MNRTNEVCTIRRNIITDKWKEWSTLKRNRVTDE